ncbi:4-hydroxybenzoate polyprenyltransferase [Lutibacter sp. Hel_I_33_5]|uniref:geranylgeranylglycerol-phosphate geranylgeranyltransferase n=1 Tax=Lutibacter sp. Hel_I_33_5 TaxID=1566289 RepID=UPI00119D5C03|nr:geranylgeranylglycerol-phosphate geranylgeranyltransferase [Lutibacter sp. Hel_I_33_5]TVZ55816.1 4-hydroxybenzoate polyprenyltransferase [Lutibacter sp. Hel_I_33_5]
MATTKPIVLLYKLFSFLSVIRGYNILVLVAAQYLAAIFIFSPKKSPRAVILDSHLFYIVLASVFVVAAGYIINNFYDSKADTINRPLKTGIDSYIKQSTKLSIYFFLNIVGVSIGFLVSWRVALFFSIYIFGIWFYSHKLKRFPFTGIFSATILMMLPFFAVFIYFKNFSKIIFVHAIFLFLVIMVRELIKELENIKGAIINNYKTFPVAYGEKRTKQVSIFLLFLTVIPIVILFSYPAISLMKYYFYFALLILIFVGIYLWVSTKRKQYGFLHNVLKFLLVIGVLSLLFIDTSLIVEKVIDKLN